MGCKLVSLLLVLLDRILDVRYGLHYLQLELFDPISKECFGDGDSHLAHVIVVTSKCLHSKGLTVFLERACGANIIKAADHNLDVLILGLLLDFGCRTSQVVAVKQTLDVTVYFIIVIHVSRHESRHSTSRLIIAIQQLGSFFEQVFVVAEGVVNLADQFETETREIVTDDFILDVHLQREFDPLAEHGPSTEA